MIQKTAQLVLTPDDLLMIADALRVNMTEAKLRADEYESIGTKDMRELARMYQRQFNRLVHIMDDIQDMADEARTATLIQEV